MARIGAYAVIASIGAGGFGEVFRARHLVLEREVAIKVLHAHRSESTAAARFVAEARVVNRISHPGIVDIFDFGELEDGRQYYVMELLRGRTLRELLRERGTLSLAEALPILRGIAAAVDAAHAAGVAHRDLKPENIFVDREYVKLIDFGLAKLVENTCAPVTETGTSMGTPTYMSPEQCRGRRVGLATDHYSFGVIAFEMLAGARPFDGDPMALALAHLNELPPPPSRHEPEIPSHIDAVILKLLDKSPEVRATTLVAAVEAMCSAAGVV